MAAEGSVRLPSEIIRKIFTYVSSEECIRLYRNILFEQQFRLIPDFTSVKNFSFYLALTADVEDESLLSILISNKYVDFCREECTDRFDDIRNFIFSHRQLVFLCLNHCGNHHDPLFSFSKKCSVQSLTKFDSLTELHVKNCSFKLSNVVTLVPKLKSLRSFSWSLLQSSYDDNFLVRNVVPVCENVTKLDLDVNLNSSTWFIMFKMFSKITHLQVTAYYGDRQRWSESFAQFPEFPFCNLHTCKLAVVCPEGEWQKLDSTGSNYSRLLNDIMSRRSQSLKWEVLETWHQNDLSLDVWPEKRKGCLFLMPSEFNVVDEEDYDFLEKLSTEYEGDQLEYLAILHCTFFESLASARFSQFLHGLVLTSFNLKEINLLGTHWWPERKPKPDNLLYAISHAHGLGRLAIPSCYVFNGIEENEDCVASTSKKQKLAGEKSCADTESEAKTAALNILAEWCLQLKELDIRSSIPRNKTCETCCASSGKYLRDSDFIPILRMCNLEHLTLSKQPGLSKFDFLASIGEKCPKMKDLRLRDVGLQAQCLHLPRLFQEFPKMTSLRELSLEHDKFSLDQQSFWLGFSKLPSLKRLCIIGDFHDVMIPHYIIELLVSVKSLRTLHIHSRAKNAKACWNQVSNVLRNNPLLNNRGRYELIIEGSRDLGETFPKWDNFYVCQRMCHKVSMVGIPFKGCCCE